MKNKDDNWYENQVQDIKKRKRAMCKAISSFAYGTDFMGGKLTNKRIKELKNSLTKEKRAAKRSNKQFVEKLIEDEIENFENSK
jgi:hypothetical protein